MLLTKRGDALHVEPGTTALKASLGTVQVQPGNKAMTLHRPQNDKVHAGILAR